MEVLFLVLVLFGIILFLGLFTYFIPVGLWISAYFAGVKVAIFKDLVGMRLRKVPPRQIVGPKISATKAGLDVGLEAMEAHYLAGGDVNAVILALISSDKAKILWLQQPDPKAPSYKFHFLLLVNKDVFSAQLRRVIDVLRRNRSWDEWAQSAFALKMLFDDGLGGGEAEGDSQEQPDQ